MSTAPALVFQGFFGTCQTVQPPPGGALSAVTRHRSAAISSSGPVAIPRTPMMRNDGVARAAMSSAPRNAATYPPRARIASKIASSTMARIPLTSSFEPDSAVANEKLANPISTADQSTSRRQRVIRAERHVSTVVSKPPKNRLVIDQMKSAIQLIVYAAPRAADASSPNDLTMS